MMLLRVTATCLLAVAPIAGCGDNGPDEVPVTEAILGRDGRSLWVNLGTCTGPGEIAVEETDSEVRLRGRVPDDVDGDCNGVPVTITLDERLAQRVLIDAVSGREVRPLVRCSRPPPRWEVDDFCADLTANAG
jgi:hypothetical protein